MANIKRQGLALIELAIGIAVPGILLVWALPTINDEFRRFSQAQQVINTDIELWELRHYSETLDWNLALLSERAGWGDSKIEHRYARTNDYPFARALSPMLASLHLFSERPFETGNLLIVESTKDEMVWLKQAKLTNDWSPSRISGLTKSSASLTATYHLERIGFSKVQDLVGLLPFAKEFHSDSFTLGYIASEVVPYKEND